MSIKWAAARELAVLRGCARNYSKGVYVKRQRFANGTRRCPSIVMGEPIPQCVFDFVRERIQHATLVWGYCFAHLFPSGEMLLTKELRGGAQYIVGRYGRNFHSTDLRDDLYTSMADLGHPIAQLEQNQVVSANAQYCAMEGS